MTQILFFLDPQAFVVLQSPQKPEDILAAVKAGTWLPPALPRAQRLKAWAQSGRVMIELQGGPPPPPADLLTPGQARVLQALAEGYTSRQIATRLNLSEHTVAWYVSGVKRRLGVHTRAQAVVRGCALGLCRI